MSNLPISNVDTTSTKFSPLIVHRVVLDSLRYFFSNVSREELRWSPDPKQTGILIDTVNSVLIKDDAAQKRPRILFSRGPYTIQKTSLTGDLAEGQYAHITKGRHYSKHMNIISGNFTIIVEAYQEGTAELLADMVATFLTWSSDHICNMFRFKQFGYPMQIQDCSLDEENKEKFKIVIGSGYTTETCWLLDEDAIKLKGLTLALTSLSN